MENKLGDFIEAAGLLEYDPAAITKIYRGHPIRLISRLCQTLIPLGSFLLKIGIEKLLGSLNNQDQTKKRAKEFAELLAKLGPAFIKAGQALSTRPDVVPPVVLEELSQLQDQLPGFEPELAMACIEEDLKNNIDNIFDQLDRKPIYAASLGQVHKGILKGGTKVAVKIQRPGLREQITLDLYIVRNLAQWLKSNIKFIRSDLVALIDELGTRVFEEMDYYNEASNAERFKRLHQDNPRIKVPEIFMNATSRRVLTMEWIDGVKLTNIEAVKKLGIDPDEMIEIGVNCSLKQLLEHGFFHADPHPGNLLALPDGNLCYLDFGMMSEVSRESRTGLIQAVVHLVNKKFNKLSKDFVDLGFLADDIDLEPIVPAFEKVFTQALAVGVNRMDFKSVTDDLSGIMYKFPFRVPPYYALIIRSLITLEGIALSVDPNFKILGAAYPYFARRLMEDNDPQLRNSLKEMIFEKNKFSWNKLDNLLTSAASQAELDIKQLTDQVFDFLFSNNGKSIREEVKKEIIVQIDQLGWKIINKFKSKQQNTILKSNTKVKSIRTALSLIKKIPKFKFHIILKHMPKFLIKSEGRQMSLEIAKGVTEKSIVRLVKIAAGTQVDPQ